MKVAIVGLGHIAQHQIDAIQQLAGSVELVGAYDTDARAPHRRALLCRFHKSLDDLMESSAADVVVISTPNRDHFATTSRLLGAGRAVLVEKPVCENRKDLNKLVKLAEAGGVFLHTAFHSAFALDLLWWLENRKTLARRFGPLERFHMGFFDPYIGRDGTVRKSARGLGGSWIDSGINALSVIGRIADPASIRVTGAEMFSAPHIAASQVNGSARLRCKVDGTVCTGAIHTDWALDLNRKTSLLCYSRATILLDHSDEQVIIRNGDGPPECISLQNGLPRLTNQYVGVFRDLAASFARHKDNRQLAARLHALMFAAMDKGAGGP